MTTLAYQLPLVFVSGILGSAHCIGMCGAISATMSLGAKNTKEALNRQLLWSCGRIFTYAFLGMVAGFGSLRLSQNEFIQSQSHVVDLQAAFAILAGALLLIQGLISLGWISIRIPARLQSHNKCVAVSVFGDFLKGGSRSGVFAAGILTGFLPCGLVYSFLALAATTTSIWQAPLIMIAFGSGTVPIMAITGTGLTAVPLSFRKRLMKAAAVCVMLTGVLTLGRGIAFAGQQESPPEDRCPFCESTEEP